MEINISGIKCDHCSYREDDVKFYDYVYYIDKPCPKCGENLLTLKEYDKCLSYYRTVHFLNNINNVLKWFNPFHYYRLIFGDNRDVESLKIKFKNRK